MSDRVAKAEARLEAAKRRDAVESQIAAVKAERHAHLEKLRELKAAKAALVTPRAPKAATPPPAPAPAKRKPGRPRKDSQPQAAA